MAEPIRQINLIDSPGGRLRVFLIAKISDQEDLVLEGQDVGAQVEEYWGDSDYEYWVVVPKAYKDAVLLWLLKERFAGGDPPAPFNDDSDFTAWLKAKGVPYQFSSYT